MDTLFFYGASGDIKNNLGQSLWFSAVEPDTPGILGYLKENTGTTFNDPDNIGMTPLDWATMHEKYDAAIVLRHWGADRLNENEMMKYHNGLILPKSILDNQATRDAQSLLASNGSLAFTVQDLLRDWRKGGGTSQEDHRPPSP